MLGLSINTTSSLSHGMISLGIQLKIIVVHYTHFCLHDKISKLSLELVAKRLQGVFMIMSHLWNMLNPPNAHLEMSMVVLIEVNFVGT